jgi:hypothetical protein
MEAEQRKIAEPIQHYIKLIVEQKVVFEGVQGTQMCSGEHLLSYKGLFKQTAAAHGFSDEKVRDCVEKKKLLNQFQKHCAQCIVQPEAEQALEDAVVQEHTQAAR